MAHSKVIDEIFDDTVEEMFQQTNPLYGKFVDQNGVYAFENGSFIQVIDGTGIKFRGKRAELAVLDDYGKISSELIYEVLNNSKTNF